MKYALLLGISISALAQATAIPFNTIDPNSFEAQLLLARQLRDQNKTEEAYQTYRKALALNPSDIYAQFELAHLLHMQHQFYEAIEHYHQALTIEPNNPNIFYNLADAYRKIGTMNLALECYEKLNATESDNPHLHYGLAECHLMLGNYTTGFKEFEWRWRRMEDKRNFSEKLWHGDNPSGKRILLRAEYGQGDTIHFIRYAQLLKQQGAFVIAEVQRSLVKLLSLCPYIDQVIEAIEPVDSGRLPEFDVQIPIMSLPNIYKTTVETIPNKMPYLYADPALATAWQQQLAHDKNYKIGICWSVSPYFESFKSPLSKKAISLALFEPIAQIPNTSLYSLQKNDGLDQLNNLPNNINIHYFGKDFDEAHGRFMDTAALIQNLDLVITVDTSVAHLAGALGKKVWVLLPYIADWRWMQDRSDSPWYPTMRLFRQTKPQDWQSVMQEVSEALQQERTSKTAPHVKKRSGIVCAEICHGELIDKITILEIKKAHIADPKKRANVEKELATLMATYQNVINESPELLKLKQDLYEVNLALWDLEDDIREKEQLHSFGRSFAKIARNIYLNNDQRATLKKQINTLSGSPIVEEKSYNHMR